MKKIFEGYNYVLAFLGIELLIFFAIYVVHVLIFKGFALPDSLIKGGYEIFWHFISLQLFMQAAFIFAFLRFGFPKELPGGMK